MHVASLARLLTLAAIWGASFSFMRIGVPVLGATVVASGRLLFAALFLWLVARVLRRRLPLRARWKHYLVLGVFNSALPFLLFAFAAKTLPVSVLAILNATAPIWGALIEAARTRRLPTVSAACGMIIGVAGVAVLVYSEQATLAPGAAIAVLAGLAAALSYSLASAYSKCLTHGDPFGNAHGSTWAAALLLAPAAAFFLPLSPPGLHVFGALLALGVVCTGVAYLLYFRLIVDLGATSALTVTYLIPVFGALWGVLFLDETVGWHTLVGCIAVLAGTALVTGLPGKRGQSPRSRNTA